MCISHPSVSLNSKLMRVVAEVWGMRDSLGRKSLPISMQKRTKSSMKRSTSNGNPRLDAVNSSSMYSLRSLQNHNPLSDTALELCSQFQVKESKQSAACELLEPAKLQLQFLTHGSGAVVIKCRHDALLCDQKARLGWVQPMRRDSESAYELHNSVTISSKNVMSQGRTPLGTG